MRFFTQGCATYIKSTFSTFIAGKSVKVLMTRQNIAHAALRNIFERMNDVPDITGHAAPRMNSPVNISR